MTSSSSIELRNSWIEQNEEPLNEHASLVEQEEIGSGIQYLDAEAIENDDIEQRLEREGGKTGEVQISLTWDDYNDLDLHIFCPSGERIYFNNKTSECGGELDVDMNVRPTSDNAVENVVWIENAPSGKYKVGVHFYKHHEKDGTTPTCDFRLRATIHGEKSRFFRLDYPRPSNANGDKFYLEKRNNFSVNSTHNFSKESTKKRPVWSFT